MPVDVRVPPLGESVSQGTIVRWLKQDGDLVRADEPILELETDKATMELVAETPGRLQILAPPGTTVGVGTVVGRITADEAEPPEPAPLAEAPRERLSPAVRKLVAEHDVEPAAIAGTGKAGRLTKGDVLRHVEETRTDDDETTERVPMSQLRRLVAERLVAAQQAAAILTTFNEADLDELQALRRRHREAFRARHGVDLGLVAFFARACVVALREVPIVNARLDGDDIVYARHVHLGIAVATPRGLVVPVVRHAERLGLAGLERAITELAELARNGRIGPERLMGGTFTITNGGVFGSLLSTPILNPPQSGILGMHRIQERPVAVDGQVVIRPMMYLALSYDHRLVDGEQAVTFLVRVKEQLEDPARMLLEV